jgi:hypothetical protein
MKIVVYMLATHYINIAIVFIYLFLAISIFSLITCEKANTDIKSACLLL